MKQEVIELLQTLGYEEERRFTNETNETFIYYSKKCNKPYNVYRVFVFIDGTLASRTLRIREDLSFQKDLDILQIEYNNLVRDTDFVERMLKVAKIPDVASKV